MISKIGLELLFDALKTASSSSRERLPSFAFLMLPQAIVFFDSELFNDVLSNSDSWFVSANGGQSENAIFLNQVCAGC
jgi:hypothetical protein